MTVTLGRDGFRNKFREGETLPAEDRHNLPGDGMMRYSVLPQHKHAGRRCTVKDYNIYAAAV